MFLSTRWNGRLAWHPARRAANSKQHCCIVSCSKQLCWTLTLLLYRVHHNVMRILFYVLLQHSVWIRMISMAKMLPGTYNTRQRTQKYRWCSRFDGALLPTSFEQIKHRALLRTFPSPTPRRNNCQYQVLPSLSTTHLSPTMVEGSTSSSPPRASDADDGVLDGSPPSARSMVSLVGDC